MTDKAKALVERCKGHTPGPWWVSYYDCGDQPHYDHNGPCPSIQAPDSEDCAIVHWDGFKQQYWSSANGNQKQIEANANLIAAAPEMLDLIETQAREIERLREALALKDQYFKGITKLAALGEQ